MKKKYIKLFPLLSLFGLLFSISCSDTESGGMDIIEEEKNEFTSAKLQISLVDAPADYEAVLIDIQEVQLKMDNKLVSIPNFKPEIYNLLDLTAGNEAFLGEINLPNGDLNEIRLILGDFNVLKTEGKDFPLKIPSGSESGLKLKVNMPIEGGNTYKLVLDFDAGKSIVKAGKSGKYMLKPVIRAKFNSLSGEIKGKLDFENASILSSNEKKGIIYAISLTDSITSYPNSNGEFLFPVLEEGLYQILVSPANETKHQIFKINNVKVETRKVTDIGNILIRDK